MDSCPLPLDVCELVIDTLVAPYGYRPMWSKTEPLKARTLCACARTCRAWRVHAQWCLWAHPVLRSSRSISLFIDVILSGARGQWLRSIVQSLGLVGPLRKYAMPLSTATALFLCHFPNFTVFVCADTNFGLNHRMLSTRTPFFRNIKALQISHNLFDSIRGLLDVVWACPNVTGLDMTLCHLRRRRDAATDAAAIAAADVRAARLSALCKQLGACAKLTSLSIDDSGRFLRAAVRLSGSVFGSAVTSLVLILYDQSMTSVRERLNSFIGSSFPALAHIDVQACGLPGEEVETECPSLLIILATTLARPEVLQKATLSVNASCTGRHKCAGQRQLVREDDDVLPSGEPLRTCFPRLESLTFIFHQRCVKRSAAYIDASLPSFRDILHFSRPIMVTDDDDSGQCWYEATEYRLPRKQPETGDLPTDELTAIACPDPSTST